MHSEKAIEHKEKMELSHEPVPPYRSVFFVAITVASLYLGVVLFVTML